MTDDTVPLDQVTVTAWHDRLSIPERIDGLCCDTATYDGFDHTLLRVYTCINCGKRFTANQRMINALQRREKERDTR